MPDLGNVAYLGIAVKAEGIVETNAQMEKLDSLSAKAEAALGGVGTSAKAAGQAIAGAASIINNYNVVTNNYQASTSNAAKAIAAHSAAVNDNARSHANNSIAAAEAIHIIKSLGEQLAAGVSPMRAFTMEGGRIATLFQYGGGLNGLLTSAGSIVGGLVNPFTIAAGAVTGFGAAAIIATRNYQAMRAELDRSLTGVGRMAGLSADGLNSLAMTSASRTGVGVNDSRTNAEALVATGKFNAGNLSGALGLTRGAAGAYGLSDTEAGSKIAEMLSDPSKGLDELNKRFGFLTDATRETVKSLQAQGDTQGALRVAIDATSVSLSEMVKPQGPLDRFTTWFSNRNAQLEAAIGSALSPTTDRQTYLNASRNGDRRSMGLLFPLERVPSYKASGLDDDGSVNAAESIRFAGQLRSAQQNSVVAARQSIEGGDVVRSVLPDVGRYQTMVDEQKKLSAAINNPDALKNMGVTADQAHDALDRLNVGLSTFKSTAQQIVEASQFAVASTQARTLSDRTAVDYQKNYTESLERTYSALEAAVTAETRRNEAIATANRSAEDALRSTSDRAALLGLSPYDKTMEESRQRYRDLNNNTIVNTSGAPATWPMAPGGSGGFDSALAFTMRSEGGWNGRDTNGTPSNMGINAAANPGVDVANLTPAGAGQIYKKSYWSAINADSMSPAMAKVAFDTAVMEGVGQAMKLITKSNGNPDTLLDLRQGFEGSLLARDPAKYGPYAKAWSSRDAGLRADIDGGGSVAGTMVAGDNQVRSTAALTNRVNYAVGRQADVSNLLSSKVDNADDGFDAQAKMLEVQRSTIGQTAEAIATATERQKEWNEITAMGVTQQKLMNDFGAAGTKMWGDLTDKINDNAAAAGRIAADQDRMKKATGALDEVRGDFSSGAGTIVTDMEKGKGFGSSLRDAAYGLGQHLQTQGINSLTSSLFGERGTPGGGLFGNAIGGLFGGGGSAKDSATITAGTVYVNAATALGGGGAAGAPGTAGGGGLFGWIGSLFGGGGGSAAGAASTVGAVGLMARGGPIVGPGTETSDSVLTRVSHGEYIIRAAAAKAHRGLLDVINGPGISGFALGGLVPGGSADKAGCMLADADP